MNLPPLTAEVSLYPSNGHYRTNAGTSLVGSSTRRISRIYPTQSEITSTLTGGDNGIITLPGTEIITVHSCPPGYEDQEGHCVPIGGTEITTVPGTIPTIGTEIITVYGTVPAISTGGPPTPPPTLRNCWPGELSGVTLDQKKACRNGYRGDLFCDKDGTVLCCRRVDDTTWSCQRVSELWRTPPPGFRKCGDQDLENNHVTPRQEKACWEGYGGDFYCDLKTGEMLCCRRDNDQYWQCKDLKQLRQIPIPNASVFAASGKRWKTPGDGRKNGR
jgi:hypothetical protein